jgi:hypothetical protein
LSIDIKEVFKRFFGARKKKKRESDGDNQDKCSSADDNANETKRESSFSEIIEEYEAAHEVNNLDTDEYFKSTIEYLKLRDEEYYTLLKDYVVTARTRNSIKDTQKKNFYDLIKNILYASICIFFLFCIRLLFSPTKDIVELFPIIIAGAVAFFAEFISLPTIIARYLFNNSEDDNITKIINHTQDFDISGRRDVYGKRHGNKSSYSKK